MKATQRSRAGLSLLEVILATAIFVASVAVIGHMLDAGLLIVSRSDRDTIGLLRAESKMEEIVAGIQPLEEDSSATPEFIAYEDDVRWRFGVTSVPTPVSGLWRVTVEVAYFDDPEATEEEPDESWTLTRLVTDPALFRSPKEEPIEPTGTITVPEMLGIGPPPAGGPVK